MKSTTSCAENANPLKRPAILVTGARFAAIMPSRAALARGEATPRFAPILFQRPNAVVNVVGLALVILCRIFQWLAVTLKRPQIIPCLLHLSSFQIANPMRRTRPALQMAQCLRRQTIHIRGTTPLSPCFDRALLIRRHQPGFETRACFSASKTQLAAILCLQSQQLSRDGRL